MLLRYLKNSIKVIATFSLYLIVSCLLAPKSSKFIVLSKRIPDDCIHELARPDSFAYAQDCWLKSSFDIQKFMHNRRKNKKKNKNSKVDPELDLAHWFEEKKRGCFSKWNYIGSIGDYSIIHTVIDGDTWRDYSLIILKLEKNILTITDQIYGLKNCEILSGKIDNDTLIYNQNIDGENLLSIIKAEHPNQWEKLSEQNKELLSIEWHSIEYANKLDKNGKIISKKMLSYE